MKRSQQRHKARRKLKQTRRNNVSRRELALALDAMRRVAEAKQ